MSMIPSIANRLGEGASILRELAQEQRRVLSEQVSGTAAKLTGTKGRIGPVASRARRVIAGSSTPNIGTDTSETAISVADAAKRMMLDKIEADGLDLLVIRDVAFQAVTEASEAGADITAAAVGATSGAVASARDEGTDVEGPGRAAAQGAIEAATKLGEIAGRRVREAIERRTRGIHLID